MKRMLRDTWYDARPFIGHALIGMAVALILSSLVLTVIASTFGVSGTLLVDLAMWVMGLFIASIVIGAFGILAYCNPWDRQEYHARHALRRSERL